MNYKPTFYEWKPFEDNGIYVSREFKKSDILNRVMLPITPGCYVWKYNNSIVYIGRSSNVRDRLGAHLFSKISGPRSNAIFSTTARDTIIRHSLSSHNDIEAYRNLTKEQKSSNEEFISYWNKLNMIINESSFIIYSTKDSLQSYELEKNLILELKPVTNNVIPNTIRKRDDFKVLGIKI